MNPADLPAGTVYVPVLAGSTKPLPTRRTRPVRVRRCREGAYCDLGSICPRPWLVAMPVGWSDRDFRTFEDARLFVVAFLDGREQRS